MTFGRWVVGLLLLMAFGVLVKLILQLTGVYVPPASMSAQRTPVVPTQTQPIQPPPGAQSEAPAAQPQVPAAPAAEPAPAPVPERQAAPEPERAVETQVAPASEAEPAGQVSDDATKADDQSQTGGQDAVSGGPSAPNAVVDAAADGVPVRYLVQPGDTLWHIARRSCGGGVKYRAIHQVNRAQIRNPHRIWPGQVVVIPDICR